MEPVYVGGIVSLLVILVVVEIVRDVVASDRGGRDPRWLALTRLGSASRMRTAAQECPLPRPRTDGEQALDRMFSRWEQEHRDWKETQR